MNESISILSIFLLVNMTLITSTCHAQNRSDYPWEEVMENLSISDEEGDIRNWENELEELTDLVNNPVNINSATKSSYSGFLFLMMFRLRIYLRTFIFTDRCRLSMNFS